jgi:sigma-B regulation protein RsbU (phosphoserine phosphatase)
VRLNAWWILLAVAIDGLIAVVDLALGDATLLAGLLIAGPLLAAARLSAAVTGAIAGYALVLAIALGLRSDVLGADYLLRCLTVALGGGFATLTARINAERTAALTRITEVAEVAQRVILRPIPQQVGGMALAAHYRSATRNALIGGDFYDVALTPYGLRLILGDVKGKGLQATQLAADVLGRFREHAYAFTDLVQLARALDAGTGEGPGMEDFVTVVLAEFGPGEVRLVNCGHHPPLRIGRHIDVLAPTVTQPPLGLHPDPVLHRARLAANHRLLFYTDGLAEARDRNGTMFSFDDQVRRALTRPLLDDSLHELLALLLGHTGSALRDDLALVLCQPAFAHAPDPARRKSGSTPIDGIPLARAIPPPQQPADAS